MGKHNVLPIEHLEDRTVLSGLPTVTVPDVYVLSEDVPLTVAAGGGLLSNDVNLEGDAQTASLVTGPLFGTVVVNGDGSFTYTPNPNIFGVDTFTYTVFDGTTNSVLPGLVTLTINPVNDLTVTLPDTYLGEEDDPLIVDAAHGVLVNDIELDGDPVSAQVLIGPLFGNLVLNPDGSFIYTPQADFFGVDSFTYAASDGFGLSVPTAVVLTIGSVLDVAVPVPDAYLGVEDTTLTVNAANGVLANDINIESDPMSASLLTPPLFGNLVLNPDGSFVYTPNANFAGVDTFTYTVSSLAGISVPAPVVITLDGVLDLAVPLPDAYLGVEDTTLAVNAANGVLANDLNIDGDPLTASLLTGPLFGSVVLNPDGSFTYTPNANFAGVDTFTYTVSSLAGISVPAPVVITLDGVLDLAVPLPDAYLGVEDTTLVVNAANGVLANDLNLDGDPLTASLLTGPLFGSVVLNPNGSFTYTPNANFAGVDTFTYTVSSLAGISVPAPVVITLDGVLDLAVPLPDAYLGVEDTTLVVNAANGVLANDLNLDGDPLTASLLTSPLFGSVVLNADGSFTYTPNANFAGVDTFTYTVSSLAGISVPAPVVITLAGVLDLAVPLPDAYLGVEDAPLVVNAANGVLANDLNLDGDPLSASLLTSPLFGSVVLNADGSFTYTPNPNFFGVDTFTYTVSSLAGISLPAAVVITTNGLPDNPIAVPDTYVGLEDSTLTVNAANGVLANDFDLDGDSLTASLVTAPLFGTLTLNPNGSFNYVPNANFAGVDTFTYQANDGTSNSLPTVVTLTLTGIADAPIALPDFYAGVEDSGLTVNAANGVLANDIDPDGDLLTAVLSTGPQFGSLTLNPNGSFSYVPNANFFGVDTFAYMANDGSANSLPIVVTLTIGGVADTPIGVPDAYVSVQGSPLVVTAANGVLANDVDLDGDSLTASLVSGPANGTLTLNANGSFTYTSNGSFIGVDTFSYRANDGSSNSLPTAVVITVTGGSNGTPVAAADTYVGIEDTTLTVSAAAGVLANDFDANGDTLTAVLVAAPSSGSLTLNADGSFVYVPAANFNGSTSFSYAATDGVFTSAPVTVTFNFSAVNDVTTVTNDAYSVLQDTALSVSAANGVLANDVDVDGDSLTASVLVQALNGTVVMAGNGSFVYTPNPGFIGVDAFSYTVSDGVSTSAPALVTIAVTAVSDTPVALPDVFATNEDTPLILTAANGVLANDSDPNGDTLTASLVNGPSHGTLALAADGSLVYTPNLNYHGSDSFTYRANDGGINSANVTVTLTVNSVNDLPLSANDAYFLNEDASLTVSAANGVLVNDSDADGDSLTAVLVSTTSHGTLVLNADGSFTYTPGANFNGSDSFTYRANDGTALGTLVTVTITVNPEPEAPVLTTSAGANTAKKHKKVLVDPAIQLSDGDSPVFTGGQFDARVQASSSHKDTLGYRHGGAKKGLVNAKHGQLRIGRTAIGSITGGKHGTAVHVNFNSEATISRVELALQNLKFRGSAKSPGAHQVMLQISDNTQLESNTASKTVDIVR